MSFRFSDAVGCYRLVVSEELLAFIERAFVAPAAEADRAAVRAEALAEAAAAELEIEPGGVIVSRAAGQEFYRIGLPVTEDLLDELVFEKSPGQLVTLRVPGPGSVVAVQAGRPQVTFVRVR